MTDEQWRTFDFKPAPIGWRVVFAGKATAYVPEVRSMPGWLMQARRLGPVIHHEREVRIVPAVVAQGEVVHVEEAEGVYGPFRVVLAPADSEPGLTDSE